jgi:hypothetical protein
MDPLHLQLPLSGKELLAIMHAWESLLNDDATYAIGCIASYCCELFIMMTCISWCFALAPRTSSGAGSCMHGPGLIWLAPRAYQNRSKVTCYYKRLLTSKIAQTGRPALLLQRQQHFDGIKIQHMGCRLL